MADTPKVASKDSLLKYLEQVEKESIFNVGGLAGHNPFLWAKRNVAPLVAEVKAAKEVTAELEKKVMALKAIAKPAPPAAK